MKEREVDYSAVSDQNQLLSLGSVYKRLEFQKRLKKISEECSVKKTFPSKENSRRISSICVVNKRGVRHIQIEPHDSEIEIVPRSFFFVDFFPRSYMLLMPLSTSHLNDRTKDMIGVDYVTKVMEF